MEGGGSSTSEGGLPARKAGLDDDGVMPPRKHREGKEPAADTVHTPIPDLQLVLHNPDQEGVDGRG